MSGFWQPSGKKCRNSLKKNLIFFPLFIPFPQNVRITRINKMCIVLFGMIAHIIQNHAYISTHFFLPQYVCRSRFISWEVLIADTYVGSPQDGFLLDRGEHTSLLMKISASQHIPRYIWLNLLFFFE